MKYPAILRNILGNQTVLAVNAKLFIHMSGEFELEDSESYSFDSHYTKITHEYLSNTWGVVESKEHAEFIIELAMSNNLDLYEDEDSIECNYFTFNEGSKLFFYEGEDDLSKDIRKQITIPLPPKAKDEEKISYTIKKGIQPKKDCEDFELTGVDSIGCAATVSVSFNDNDEMVNVECESSLPKAKGRPQVGDEVLFTPNPSINHSVLCDIKYIGDKHIILKSKEGREYSRRIAKAIIKKPKSKQELLIEELQTKLCNNNAVDNYILACDIINGDIEGLSYE